MHCDGVYSPPNKVVKWSFPSLSLSDKLQGVRANVGRCLVSRVLALRSWQRSSSEEDSEPLSRLSRDCLAMATIGRKVRGTDPPWWPTQGASLMFGREKRCLSPGLWTREGLGAADGQWRHSTFARNSPTNVELPRACSPTPMSEKSPPAPSAGILAAAGL